MKHNHHLHLCNIHVYIAMIIVIILVFYVNIIEGSGRHLRYTPIIHSNYSNMLHRHRSTTNDSAVENQAYSGPSRRGGGH